jgi:hypothetical protein
MEHKDHMSTEGEQYGWDDKQLKEEDLELSKEVETRE